MHDKVVMHQVSLKYVFLYSFAIDKCDILKEKKIIIIITPIIYYYIIREL